LVGADAYVSLSLALALDRARAAEPAAVKTA
ncbi:MAG: hypothetical protein QOH86_2248, partial [Sphingomonadales bacterium]|nr:hypothetical protein [Sphingomonadales bacterium]